MLAVVGSRRNDGRRRRRRPLCGQPRRAAGVPRGVALAGRAGGGCGR
jgi:hypothetical protein